MTTTHSPFPAMGHQIPFRQPAITVPLTWTFGAPPQSFPSPVSPLTRKDTQLQQPIASSSKSRKRCASEEMAHDEPLPSPSRAHLVGTPKRPSKRTCGLSDSDMASGAPTKDNPTDLGKAFASLTKPELITLLHELLRQKPDLKGPIESLLPAPTLESISLRLEELENGLLEVIPNKRLNREEYIWNRVRVPLHGYVADCLNWLRLTSQACCQSPGPALERSEIHASVSDQFKLLSRLSYSIKKIENQLPSPTPTGPAGGDLNSTAAHPLQSVLIPALFENWKGFLEAIHRIVFVEGIILSESLIRKWFHQLDQLASSSQHHHQQELLVGQTQRLMVVIREEAMARFGDLVGLRNVRMTTGAAGAAAGGTLSLNHDHHQVCSSVGRSNQMNYEEMI